MQTPKKEIQYILTLICVLLLSIITIRLSFRFLTPMIISFVIALILNPIVVFAKNKFKIKKSIMSLLLIIIILGIFIGLIVGSINIIGNEISSFIGNFPQNIENFKTLIENVIEDLNKLPFIQINITENIANFDFSPYILGISNMIAGIGSRMPDIFIKTIFIVLMTFFFIVNMSNIKQWISNKFSQTSLQNIGGKLKQIIGGYFIAQFKLLIIMFIILVITFSIVKVPYAISMAIITAVLDCLPIFGTGTILIPYVIIEIAYQNYQMAFYLFLIYVGTQLFRRFVEPKILGSTIGLDTFMSIICLFVGYQLMGTMGLILGIPIGVIIKYCNDLGVFDKPKTNLQVIKNWIFNILKS